MKRPAEQPERYVIAASSFADAEDALKLVRSLVGMRRATLAGFFMDEDMAELALSARQRVITASGELIDVPSRQKAQVIVESDARAFRRQLSEIAHRSSTTWTFKQERGELVSGVCASLERWDIVLFGHHRPAKRLVGHVLLIGQPQTENPSARALAEAIAQDLGTKVIDLEPEPTASAADIVARIDRLHAAAVVVDLAEGPLKSVEELRLLISAARCPVAVLGVETLRAKAQESQAL